ncbi:MAG: 30S ribosomal protein S17 [Bacteroidetes bacterium]|jgi:small subunit ribosomal protein S17|nr:30S ribosomal protein S17 [Bacteroidota bacterium]
MEENKSIRKTRIGVVASDKMEKTITVRVERRIKHPIYGKFMKKSKKFFAHDPGNDCNAGDTVKIEETRPLSAKKRWRLIEILERAK